MVSCANLEAGIGAWVGEVVESPALRTRRLAPSEHLGGEGSVPAWRGEDPQRQGALFPGEKKRKDSNMCN